MKQLDCLILQKTWKPKEGLPLPRVLLGAGVRAHARGPALTVARQDGVICPRRAGSGHR